MINKEIISRIKYKLFGQDIWRIGLINNNFDFLLKNKISENDIKWLQINDTDDYEADPFLFSLDNTIYIAYERFNYLHGNAKIGCIDLNGNKYNFFSEINKKGHKSFPCIFDDGGETYCIPETSDKKNISLYKYNKEKKIFSSPTVLLKNQNFIDSSITKKDGIYYLFTSTTDNPHKQQLYTSNEIGGPYIEHPKSPIADNIKHGRNGGNIVTHNDQLYRISQNCQDTYGGSICIMKINKIEKDNYNETLYKQLLPITPYLDGIHTLSVHNNKIVIDGKTKKIKLTNLFRKVIYKILIKNNIERKL